MNATITQQQSSNFDQGGYMSQIPPQINKELNVDIKTQSQQNTKTKSTKAKPQTLQSMSADPYRQSQNNNNTVNLMDFPIFETLNREIDYNNNDNGNNNNNTQHIQPPLRAIASAPESHSNNNNNSTTNGFGIATNKQQQTNHHLSPTHTINYNNQQQYNQYTYHSPNTPTTQQIQLINTQNTLGSQSAPYNDEYTSDQLRRMYEQYQNYYNKYKQQQQYNKQYHHGQHQQHQRHQQHQQQYQRKNKYRMCSNNNNNSHNEYMKYLIKTVRDQTEEINQMQQTISHLRRKINTRQLLEEDFYSFLSRIEFPHWISDSDKALCFNKLFENEKKKLDSELSDAKLNRREAATKNLMLETNIIELTDNISALRDYLEQEKHKNYLQSVNHNKNLAAKIIKKKKIHTMHHTMYHTMYNRMNTSGATDYPPENIIIQNLIRTQIEFYFSDYNLKRDKRLLDQLCSDRIGFLKIDSVMNLTRVRQLSSHRNQVINSLRSSKFLSLTADNEWVGRLGFERPQEKQFPFRRTVFVFGLPMNCTEKYVTEMLSPFGKLSKVKFDHGPDTLDRLVSENMFKEIKVYKYRDHNRILYNYKQEIMVGGSPEYNCNKCQKLKQCDEGFYETSQYQILICLQCAAANAELILEKCKVAQTHRMIELLCGKPPRDVNKTKTALAVFTSQRQASKCVYVRSRIAFDGCFATHYHHYSKLKKEIALTLQPFADKLREIPPRRVLNEINNNKLQPQQPLPLPPPPQLHNDIDDDDDDDDDQSNNTQSDQSDQSDLLIKISPKLAKLSVGSLTAPVVGGSGEIYLMRAAYNKVNKNNSSINASFVDDAK